MTKKIKAYVRVNFNTGKIHVVDVDSGINLMWFTDLDRAEAYADELNNPHYTLSR